MHTIRFGVMLSLSMAGYQEIPAPPVSPVPAPAPTPPSMQASPPYTARPLAAGTVEVAMAGSGARGVSATRGPPPPPPLPPHYPLTIAGPVMREGMVTSEPEGIRCAVSPHGAAGTCTGTYDAGATIRLRITPSDLTDVVLAWNYVPCDHRVVPGTAAVCTVVVNGPVTVWPTVSATALVSVRPDPAAFSGAGRLVSFAAIHTANTREQAFGFDCVVHAQGVSGACISRVPLDAEIVFENTFAAGTIQGHLTLCYTRMGREKSACVVHVRRDTVLYARWSRTKELQLTFDLLYEGDTVWPARHTRPTIRCEPECGSYAGAGTSRIFLPLQAGESSRILTFSVDMDTTFFVPAASHVRSATCAIPGAVAVECSSTVSSPFGNGGRYEGRECGYTAQLSSTAYRHVILDPAPGTTIRPAGGLFPWVICSARRVDAEEIVGPRVCRFSLSLIPREQHLEFEMEGTGATGATWAPPCMITSTGRCVVQLPESRSGAVRVSTVPRVPPE